MRSVVDQFDNYAKLNKKLPAETSVQLGQIEDASKLADAVAANITIKVSDKQALLAELNPVRRLEMAFAFMEGELGVRSEERRVGKECVSPCRSGRSPIHEKKKETKRTRKKD